MTPIEAAGRVLWHTEECPLEFTSAFDARYKEIHKLAPPQVAKALLEAVKLLKKVQSNCASLDHTDAFNGSIYKFLENTTKE